MLDDPYAKMKQAVRTGLRQAWTRYDPQRESVLSQSKSRRVGKDAAGRTRELIYYRCALCDRDTRKPSVDHIVPVGALDLADLGGFARRLFCPGANLQVLCPACHLAKTRASRCAK